MRVQLIGAIVGVLGWAAAASAQFGGYGGGYGGYGGYGGGGYGYGGFGGAGFGGGGMFMPNIYNQQTQPLSPYLNMLRGSGNPAVGYYFGARPGTVGGYGGMGMAPNMAFGGMRMPFPFQITEEEPLPAGEKPEGYVLPSAGHPVMFNNTMGYYPFPGMNRYGRGGYGGGMGGGYGGGGMMRGMQGIGMNRPQGSTQR